MENREILFGRGEWEDEKNEETLSMINRVYRIKILFSMNGEFEPFEKKLTIFFKKINEV